MHVILAQPILKLYDDTFIHNIYPFNFCNKDNRATWKINQHRQIQYTQTREQHFQLLRDLLKSNSVPGLNSYKDELKNYQSQRTKGEDMPDWFKRLHPEKYFNLFDKTN